MKYLKELGMAYFLYRKDLAFFVSPKIAECIINKRVWRGVYKCFIKQLR